MYPLPNRELRYKESGEVVSEEEYKSHYPHTSFAIDWNPEDAEWVECIPPAAGPFKEVVRDGVEQIDGKWRAKWRVVQLVPAAVPMLNARLVLIEDEHMAPVEAYVDAMTGIEGEKARAFLKHSQTVRRDHYLVEVMRVLRELTHAQVDSLFVRAAAID